jgi:hypothetical protein
MVQGYLAAGLGAAAGLLQLTGSQPTWTGNKNDPITLGLVTLGLAAIIAAGAWASGRVASTSMSLAAAGALGLPALLGLTTAGIAWVPAAVLSLVAAIGELRAAARHGSVLATLDRAWPSILLFVLALIYIAFGVVESGWVGLVGITGGLSVLTSLVFRARDRWVSVVLLLAGAIPFAVVTAWTGVTVITAVLMLGVGLPGLLAGREPVRRQEEVPFS